MTKATTTKQKRGRPRKHQAETLYQSPVLPKETESADSGVRVTVEVDDELATVVTFFAKCEPENVKVRCTNACLVLVERI